MKIRSFLLACVIVLFWHTSLHAVYIKRYSTIANGGMTYTGNTLGLDKEPYQNRPGTAGSIGAFITTDMSSRAGPYWPYGTTADWRKNSSSAELRLPPGSTVLYAELIWGGSYNYGGQDVSAYLDDAVRFTTPVGSYNVSPDPSTAVTFAVLTDAPLNYYVRSADVTALVRSAGGGTYTVGGVPATNAATDNDHNAAGWTLAVIYENANLPARSMTIFVGGELSYISITPTSSVSGFSTPESGPVHARLMVSAMEGDSFITGDKMLFGPTPGTMIPISGPNNPISNFFCSQINDDLGNLDMAGTFGTRNHIPGSSSVGARQGWDITNVDVSAYMQNNQSTAFTSETSTGDGYVAVSVGLQIDIAAPQFPTAAMSVDRAQTFVGDTLTYTVKLDNTAGTVDALNVLYTDTPPYGTTFIPGTFSIEGVPQPGADPVVGVPIGTIPKGSVVTVSYKVRVNAIPFPPAVAEYRNDGKWTYQYRSAPNLPLNNGSITTNDVVTLIPRLQPKKTADPSGSVFPGEIITYTIYIPNTGTANTSGTTLIDLIPENTTYISGSTTLNGVAVADNDGKMPFSQGALVNSPGEPPGQIDAGEAATVIFQVKVKSEAPLIMANVASVDPDGESGIAPPLQAVAINPPPKADLAVSITDNQESAIPGDPITYTVTVTNNGPEERPLEKLTLEVLFPEEIGARLYTPSTGTYNSDTGLWSDLSLSSNQSITLTINGTVSPAARGTLTVTATVVPPPGVLDQNEENNTDSDTDNLTPQADLSVTKTDGRIYMRPGSSTTYTITVTNNGPSRVRTLTVQDSLPPVLSDLEFWPDQGVYNEETGLWTGLNLGPGQSVVLSVRGNVDSDASGTLENTVMVSPPAGVTDPNSLNDKATDINTIIEMQPAFIVTKKADKVSAKPGEVCSYTITYENARDSDAYNVSLIDSIPEYATYVIGSAAGTDTTVGVKFQHVEGGPFDASETAPVRAIMWTLPHLLSGESGALSFQVQVNEAVLAGTSVRNFAVVNYESPSGSPQVPVISDTSIVIVAPLAGVSVTPDSVHLYVALRDTVQHAFVVTNTGNSNDTFELTGSGGIYSWRIWRDLNGNGVIDSGDYQITDTDGDGVPDTGQMAPGASLSFVVRTVIPAGTANLTQDLYTVTATSSMDSTVSDDTKISTTIRLGHDGTITATDTIVPGQPIFIVVKDLDLNTDPNKVETITLETVNQNTGEVETLVYTEKGPDTGVFVTQVNTTFGEQAGPDNDGIFNVCWGHILTTTYQDTLTSTGGTDIHVATTHVLKPNITLKADPDVIVANGRDISQLTSRVTDANGEPLPDGTLVTFTTSKGTFANGDTIIVVPVKGGNGEATTALIAPVLTVPSVAEVQAFYSNVASDTIRLTILPGAVSIRVFDAARRVFVRGDDPQVKVQVIAKGTADDGSPVEQVIEVDSLGIYLLSDLPPGRYKVRTVVSDRTTGEHILESEPQEVKVNPGGGVEPMANTLSGTLRSRCDPSKTFANSRIELYDENGTLIATTQTDSEGKYIFDPVKPGNYYVVAITPDRRRGHFYLPPIMRNMGVVIIDADPMIDPFGVVFNAETGEGVPGVVVTIIDPQTGYRLHIPPLSGEGAPPNFYNVNPFVTDAEGRFAFLFGSNQVGRVGQPARYEIRVEPRDERLSTRLIQIEVSPVTAGRPLMRLVAVALDTLPLCEPGRFDLVKGPVIVPNIETMALNIPLFLTVYPVVKIEKKAASDSVRIGDQVEYTLVVSNSGNGAATGVTVSDTLTSGLELVSVPEGAVYQKGILVWQVGDLAPGEMDTLRFKAKVPTTVTDRQRIWNRAWVTAENAEATPDSAVITARGEPDLWIFKGCNPAEGRLGDVITYTVIVGNRGTADARGITVEDSLPPALEYVEGSGSSGAVYRPKTRTLVWSLGTVARGATDTLTFRVQIGGNLTPGMHTLENTAKLLTDGVRISSNSVILHVLIPYLKIEKSASKTVVEPGDIVRYQITVTNASVSDSVYGVYVEDNLPHGFDYVAGTTLVDGHRAGDPAGVQLLKWVIGNLGPSESRTLHYVTVAGAGAVDGAGVNEATAYGYNPKGRLFPSNSVRNKVLISSNLFAPGGVILGKVWVDANGNRIHDHGERTVPDVALMLEDGTRVITDEYGNYSIPEVKPGNHVIRLLEDTLPSGLRPVAFKNAFAGDPFSQFVYLPKYATAKANFMLVTTAVPFEKQAMRVVPPGVLKISKRVIPERVSVPVRREVIRIGAAYFRTGSAVLRPEMRSRLREVCGRLRNALYIRIEGHTDSRPIHTAEFPSNQELSEARARSVMTFLSEDCGIDPGRMIAVGYGPTRPIASNFTPEGRALNRRVEIIAAYEKPESKARVSYELTVAYTGEEPVRSVVLVDSLPSAVSLLEGTVSVDGAEAKVQTDSLGRLVWRLGDVSPGKKLRVRFDAEVKVAGLDSVVNRAYVRYGPDERFTSPKTEAVLEIYRGYSASENLSQIDNRSAERARWNTSKVEIEPGQAVVALDSTGNPAVGIGDRIRFVLTIKLPKSSEGLDAVLTDSLAEGLVYVPGSSKLWNKQTADPVGDSVLVWTLSNIPSGMTLNFAFDARVTAYPAGGVYGNIAHIRVIRPKGKITLLQARSDTAWVRVRLPGALKISKRVIPERVSVPVRREVIRIGAAYFRTGSAVLRPEMRSRLRELCGRLRDALYIRIEGHTDSRPIHTVEFPSNQELSEARARSVMTFLSEDCGIDPGRMIAVGYGPTRPIASNFTPEGRALNRRVEIIAAHEKPESKVRVSYELTVAHTGEEPVRSVVLVDSLPPAVSLLEGTVSVDGAEAKVQTDSLGRLVWRLGDVSPGKKLRVRFDAEVKVAGLDSVVNRAYVRYGPDERFTSPKTEAVLHLDRGNLWRKLQEERNP